MRAAAHGMQSRHHGRASDIAMTRYREDATQLLSAWKAIKSRSILRIERNRWYA